MPCPDCGETKTNYTLRIIPTGRVAPYPLFIPQVKESCANCGRYLRFAKQTMELIEELNLKLKEVIICGE